MTTSTPVSAMYRVAPELQVLVEQFYAAEAELLDDHRYDEWIELFTDDAEYWIPSRTTLPIRERRRQIAARDENAIADDDMDMLRGRVRRVTSGIQWSEEPPSRTRRLLTGVRVREQDGGELRTRTNFYVYRSRLERHQDWFVGERFDVLRPAAGTYPFRIADRRIVFDQTTLLSPSISVFF
ncbi:aromatic-ring-hydroxylating dioxygenase subunit beta [Streptomyces sp. NPDC090088]|uniref:aromatic-ring-hydroxylating dioxygenase subunit beta n=1 Tax=Streptomyces sp. NPDC090088 TaxID=3365944 RepID=UPI003816576C